MPHRREKVQKCADILLCKIDEYIATHNAWYPLGYLCPHKGKQEAHDRMDEIIEDVEKAHDMLEAALYLAGLDFKTLHAHSPMDMHKLEDPAHTGAARRLSVD